MFQTLLTYLGHVSGVLYQILDTFFVLLPLDLVNLQGCMGGLSFYFIPGKNLVIIDSWLTIATMGIDYSAQAYLTLNLNRECSAHCG